MPTVGTDFLAFANSPGANVLSQATYAGDVTILANGVQLGVASSALYNKTARQAALVANILTNYIADVTNTYQTDDGTTGVIISNLGQAIRLGTSVFDTSGTPNVIVGTANPAPAALIDGQIATIKVANTNTSSVTFNLNGVGAYALASTFGPLVGGELVAGYTYSACWNAAASQWILVNYQITAPTQTTGTNNNTIATTAFLQTALSSAVSGIQTVPSGSIFPYAGTSAPAGYLLCPQTFAAAQVLKTAYPNLFAACGSIWNQGGSPATGYFTIPWFPTGYTALAGPAGSVGTTTVGQVIAHSHQYDWRGSLQPQSGSSTYCWNGDSTQNTSSTGGAFNAAAGNYVSMIVKV